MKRTTSFLALLLLATLLNAQRWDFFQDESEGCNFTAKNYKIVGNTNLYNYKGNVINHIPADTQFTSAKVASVQDESVEPFDMFEYFIGYDGGWISTDNIVLEDSEVFSDAIVTCNKNRNEKRWIPAWYNTILTSGKRMENFSDIYDSFGFKNKDAFSLTDTHKIIINNTLLIFRPILGLDYYFSIKKIEKKNSVFYVQCEILEDKQNDYYGFNKIWARDSFSYLPDLTENRNCTFILEQNGNRLRLYNGENYKLIIELIQTDKAWCDSMIKYIDSYYKSRPANLKAIEEKLDHPWSDPKTGLPEGNSANKASIAPGKTMTVTENLKLRSGEATTTPVLTVMSAGTKVKILELGKAETIDGISSNWVKVEVQSDAKDRDGKTIKAGTVGWCYGGYLE
ncbi:SH3 domain-containing protein [Treponema sp. C6A8]|uniref:SH3 domain-containing protein n=1 Tax=Treponema sp. C6A8 TaxID=1410609 RepID=UPI000485F723|nr:SH3 domain-containing protein [Treponema sp. C6A8]